MLSIVVMENMTGHSKSIERAWNIDGFCTLWHSKRHNGEPAWCLEGVFVPWQSKADGGQHVGLDQHN